MLELLLGIIIIPVSSGGGGSLPLVIAVPLIYLLLGCLVSLFVYMLKIDDYPNDYTRAQYVVFFVFWPIVAAFLLLLWLPYTLYKGFKDFLE